MGRLLVLVLLRKVISILTGVYEGALRRIDFFECSMESSSFAKRISLLRRKVISILTGVYEGAFMRIDFSEYSSGHVSSPIGLLAKI